MPKRDSVLVRVSWWAPDTWSPEVRHDVARRMAGNLRNAADRVTPGVDFWCTGSTDPGWEAECAEFGCHDPEENL